MLFNHQAVLIVMFLVLGISHEMQHAFAADVQPIRTVDKQPRQMKPQRMRALLSRFTPAKLVDVDGCEDEQATGDNNPACIKHRGTWNSGCTRVHVVTLLGPLVGDEMAYTHHRLNVCTDAGDRVRDVMLERWSGYLNVPTDMARGTFGVIRPKAPTTGAALLSSLPPMDKP